MRMPIGPLRVGSIPILGPRSKGIGWWACVICPFLWQEWWGQMTDIHTRCGTRGFKQNKYTWKTEKKHLTNTLFMSIIFYLIIFFFYLLILEREKNTWTYCSIYICIHWLILVCALTSRSNPSTLAYQELPSQVYDLYMSSCSFD